MEIIPRIDAGFVAIGKHQLDRVGADRLDGRDADIFLAHLQHLLPRPVPAHLGRRRMHAQEFATEFELPAVIERHLELTRFLVQFQFGGTGGLRSEASHVCGYQGSVGYFTLTIGSRSAVHVLVISVPVTGRPSARMTTSQPGFQT